MGFGATMGTDVGVISGMVLGARMYVHLQYIYIYVYIYAFVNDHVWSEYDLTWSPYRVGRRLT